jgi:ferric iron reductase protein FhuF
MKIIFMEKPLEYGKPFTKISKTEKEAIEKLTKHFLDTKGKYTKSKELAEMLFISDSKIRMLIQIIRYYYNYIYEDANHFLIASRKGYKITTNKMLIKKYYKTLKLTNNRQLNILNNIRIVLNKKKI